MLGDLNLGDTVDGIFICSGCLSVDVVVVKISPRNIIEVQVDPPSHACNA